MMTTDNTPRSVDDGSTKSPKGEDALPTESKTIPITGDGLLEPSPEPPAPKPFPDSQATEVNQRTPWPWFTWLLYLLAAMVLFVSGVSLWDNLNGLWVRSPWLGEAGIALVVLLVLVTGGAIYREWRAVKEINQLEQLDKTHKQEAYLALAIALVKENKDVDDLDKNIRQQAEQYLSKHKDIKKYAKITIKAVERLLIYSSQEDLCLKEDLKQEKEALDLQIKLPKDPKRGPITVPNGGIQRPLPASNQHSDNSTIEARTVTQRIIRLFELMEKSLEELDARAEEKVVEAVRWVTVVPAIPWAFWHLLLVFLANIRMFRSIAEVYGNRPGVAATWIISKKILTNVVVAGTAYNLVTMLGIFLRKSFLKWILGTIIEGVTNAVLTANTGRTAMELCRPLKFHFCERSKVIDKVLNLKNQQEEAK